ncbi:hypothetical protein ACFX13_026830 [Malus domestica]
MQSSNHHFQHSNMESFWGFRMWNSAEKVFARSGSFREGGDDEEALRWAALERLPTYAKYGAAFSETSSETLWRSTSASSRLRSRSSFSTGLLAPPTTTPNNSSIACAADLTQ